jgi:hypothetical protein
LNRAGLQDQVWRVVCMLVEFFSDDVLHLLQLETQP